MGLNIAKGVHLLARHAQMRHSVSLVFLDITITAIAARRPVQQDTMRTIPQIRVYLASVHAKLAQVCRTVFRVLKAFGTVAHVLTLAQVDSMEILSTMLAKTAMRAASLALLQQSHVLHATALSSFTIGNA